MKRSLLCKSLTAQSCRTQDAALGLSSRRRLLLQDLQCRCLLSVRESRPGSFSKVLEGGSQCYQVPTGIHFYTHVCVFYTYVFTCIHTYGCMTLWEMILNPRSLAWRNFRERRTWKPIVPAPGTLPSILVSCTLPVLPRRVQAPNI